jgi:hypothetical protein
MIVEAPMMEEGKMEGREPDIYQQNRVSFRRCMSVMVVDGWLAIGADGRLSRLLGLADSEFLQLVAVLQQSGMCSLPERKHG